jgi:hypothetical protein
MALYILLHNLLYVLVRVANKMGLQTQFLTRARCRSNIFTKPLPISGKGLFYTEQ